MATRSRIAIEDQTGKVRSIYCHWDGYPSNNGRILLKHFRTQEKVESLIELGSISSLNKNVEIRYISVYVYDTYSLFFQLLIPTWFATKRIQ